MGWGRNENIRAIKRRRNVRTEEGKNKKKKGPFLSSLISKTMANFGNRS